MLSLFLDFHNNRKKLSKEIALHRYLHVESTGANQTMNSSAQISMIE